MSVENTYAPLQLTPVRSTAWVVLEGSNFRTQAPEGAIISMVFVQPSVAGDTVLMTFPWGEVLMTCAATPDDSGTEFEPGPGGIVETAAKFEEGLLSNPYITDHYRVTRSGFTVSMEGIEAGEGYELLTNTVTPGALGSIANVNSGGFIASYSANYNIVVRPYVLVDGIWQQRRDRKLVPHPETLNAELDLQEVLRHGCQGDWPRWNLLGEATLHETSTRPYYLEFFERYGTPATPRRVYRLGTPEEPLLAWYAGAQRLEHDTFRDLVEDRILGTDPAHMFLTWRNRSSRRYVTIAEQHYLGWYHWPMEATPENFQVQAKLYCTDGTVVDWTTRYNVPTDTVALRGRICSFNVGYGQLNLLAMLPVGKTPQYYSVRISETETGPKSEEMDFWVDMNDENQVYIQFLNSLGVVESFRSRGAWSETISHTYAETRRHLQWADRDTEEKGAYMHEALGGQRMLTIFSDYNNRYEHADILDLLGSPEIRLIDRLGRRIPLRLTEETEARIFGRGDPEENLHGLDLVFMLDDPQTVVTRIPAGFTENEDDGGTSGDGGGDPDPGP
jgi:hypothetical protein